MNTGDISEEHVKYCWKGLYIRNAAEWSEKEASDASLEDYTRAQRRIKIALTVVS